MIGVARQPWTQEQLRDRARGAASRRTASVDHAALDRLAARLRYVAGDYGDPATFAALRERARRSAAAAVLPGDSAEPCSARSSQGSAQTAAPTTRASWSRSRSAAISRPREELDADAARVLSGAGDLPHRPLPRQGAGPEPAVLPLRECVPRADLEPPLRRARRRSRWPRAFGVKGRGRFYEEVGVDPRRRPEPPAADPRAARDGAAGVGRWRGDRRGEGRAVRVDPRRWRLAMWCSGSIAAIAPKTASTRNRTCRPTWRPGSTSTTIAGRACRS